MVKNNINEYKVTILPIWTSFDKNYLEFHFSSACQCAAPNQVCVSGSCVCDVGFTSDVNGDCQPSAGKFRSMSIKSTSHCDYG